MQKNRRLAGLFAASAAMAAVDAAHAGLISGVIAAAKASKAAKGAAVAAGAGLAAEDALGPAAKAAAAAAAAAEAGANAAKATSTLRKALDDFDAQGGAGVADEARLSAKSTLDQGFGMALPAGRLRLLGAVRKAFGKLPKVVFASANARKFGREFLQGAKVGNARLAQLHQRSPALVGPWLRTPRERRVFIIGASPDTLEVRLLQRALKKDGFETFFYKFCEPYLAALCSTQEVGAFFATSGHVVAVKSAAAAASSFIPVELATTHGLINGGLVVVFTPDDVARLASAGGQVAQAGSVALQAETFEFSEADARRRQAA
jgi:hypothetical protein